eukprot:SAG11_NODE_3998_length_2114_cov_1.231266_2_plen_222_part_00
MGRAGSTAAPRSAPAPSPRPSNARSPRQRHPPAPPAPRTRAAAPPRPGAWRVLRAPLRGRVRRGHRRPYRSRRSSACGSPQSSPGAPAARHGPSGQQVSCRQMIGRAAGAADRPELREVAHAEELQRVCDCGSQFGAPLPYPHVDTRAHTHGEGAITRRANGGVRGWGGSGGGGLACHCRRPRGAAPTDRARPARCSRTCANAWLSTSAQWCRVSGSGSAT